MTKLWFLSKVIVSSVISTPPPRFKSRLSNDTSLNLVPKTGSNTHPLPFPPVSDTETTLSTSKSWGSTKICFTLPTMTALPKQ